MPINQGYTPAQLQKLNVLVSERVATFAQEADGSVSNGISPMRITNTLNPAFPVWDTSEAFLDEGNAGLSGDSVFSTDELPAFKTAQMMIFHKVKNITPAQKASMRNIVDPTGSQLVNMTAEMIQTSRTVREERYLARTVLGQSYQTGVNKYSAGNINDTGGSKGFREAMNTALNQIGRASAHRRSLEFHAVINILAWNKLASSDRLKDSFMSYAKDDRTFTISAIEGVFSANQNIKLKVHAADMLYVPKDLARFSNNNKYIWGSDNSIKLFTTSTSPEAGRAAIRRLLGFEQTMIYPKGMTDVIEVYQEYGSFVDIQEGFAEVVFDIA